MAMWENCTGNATTKPVQQGYYSLRCARGSKQLSWACSKTSVQRLRMNIAHCMPLASSGGFILRRWAQNHWRKPESFRFVRGCQQSSTASSTSHSRNLECCARHARWHKLRSYEKDCSQKKCRRPKFHEAAVCKACWV